MSLPKLDGVGRLIAPDLIGMGDSDKLPDPGPTTYTFENHRKHLWALLHELVGLSEKIVLVVHDWGSALGFDWAYEHPDRVLGITYMEGIVRPYAEWSEWSERSAPIFQGFRSEAGEEMILDKNIFVERVLFGSIIRPLSDSREGGLPQAVPQARGPLADIVMAAATAHRGRTASHRQVGRDLFEVDGGD